MLTSAIPDFIEIRFVASEMKHADRHTGHSHYAFISCTSWKEHMKRTTCLFLRDAEIRQIQINYCVNKS
jgi:hypothetical protein